MTKTLHACMLSIVTPLARFLKRIGASTTELAEAVSVDQTTAWRWYHGRVLPTGRNAAAILAWADQRAREKRIPRQQRLTLSDLLTKRAA